jgi:cyanophycin synthetase
MKILKTQVLRGPNVWSNYRKQLIQVKIDLEEMEQFPTDKIDGFPERLEKLLPGMIEHECSEGVRGGFFNRLQRGTWLGHVMEHVALEIQSLAGMKTGYGRTRGTGEKGVYNMVFAYTVEEAGLYAAEAAFRIVDALAKNEPYDLERDIEELKRLNQRYSLGPSTQSIVDEAKKRNIPWKRIGNGSKIQLGYGANQVRFQATMTCRTTSDAVALSDDKENTKRVLAAAHIPVAKGDVCTDEEGLMEIIDSIGYPIVVKPRDGNQGKGASINVNDDESANVALAQAKLFSDHVLVERFITGNDFRLLVIDGKFIAASKRIPAHVVGDGHSSIRKLIDIENRNPLRGQGHELALTKIKPDKDTYNQLEKYGYTFGSIPAENEIVYLKSTANLSTGGTASDVTDNIHPENKFMAERIAKLIGLDICGIDVMADSISTPIRENGGAVLEVNAAPGFRMHLNPSEGKSQNVAKAVIDMLYPEDSESRIPVISITGTNGKTTTTRLLACMAQQTGYTTGYTTTDGIYIGGYKIVDGDTTGPQSAATILEDPTVEFAVLETARGGLLRSGLAFDHCDVGVITNIEEDHLGLNDINTLEDLANVKAVVARSVKRSGWAVLNAEDAHCSKIANELDCNVAYFSLNENNEVIQKHINAGGRASVYCDGDIFIYDNYEKILIEKVMNVPLTENGKVKCMLANVLAATVAGYSWGFTIAQIRKTLNTFIPSVEQTPGRMNLFEFKNFKVLVDYAHNPHGFLAMQDYLSQKKANKKIGIISGIGDRRDHDIIECSRLAAMMFDHIIVRQEHDLRGRTLEGINALIMEGLESSGRNVSIELIPDEVEAIKHALRIVAPGNLIVALSDQYNKVIEVIREEMSKENEVVPLLLSEHINASIAS